MPTRSGVVQRTPTLVCETYTDNGSNGTIIPAGEDVFITAVFFKGGTAGDSVDITGSGITHLHLEVDPAGHTAMTFFHPIKSNGLGATLAGTGGFRYSIAYVRHYA